MDRRTVLKLGAGAVAVGALGTVGVVGVRAASPYTPPRALPTGSLSGADYDVSFGNYRIRVGSGAFSLSHGSNVVWQFGGAFLVAGLGDRKWHDRTGHFSANVDYDDICASQSIEAVDAASGVATMRGKLSGSGREFEYSLVFAPDQDGVRVRLDVPGASFTGFRVNLGVEEGVHGGGEQFTDFDLRGYAFDFVTREQGVGRGKQPVTLLAEVTNGAGGSPVTTYAPLPFLVTDTMRSIMWTNDEVASVDLRASERLDLVVWAASVDAVLEDAGNPATLLRSHTRRAGRMQRLPAWSADGAILGLQGGTDDVRLKLKRLTEMQTAVAGVWLQDWVGARVTDFGSRLWWTWELDEARYPDWDGLVGELDEAGVRVLTYVNPFVVDPSDKPTPVRRNLFAEAVDNTFLVRDAEGAPYLLDQGGFDAAMVDLTNPAARDWFSDVIASQVAAAGNGGWMADFAETLPFDAVLHDGSPADWHNRWPTAWAELNQQVRQGLGGHPRLVFHRSAWRGSLSTAGAFWAGDQLVDWDIQDGMANALQGMLAGGVSGMTMNHSDIGGYTGLNQPIVRTLRTAEVLARWAEWSAWTPLFRTHEGNLPELFSQAWDDDVRVRFAAQSRVFAALADYRAEVVEQAVTDGLPALRHCWVHYPGTLAAKAGDQYFYGDRFLVAPVMGPGARSRVVAFPPGDWINVWTMRPFAGNQNGAVQAPLGQPAVFHRANDRVAAQIAAGVRRAAL